MDVLRIILEAIYFKIQPSNESNQVIFCLTIIKMFEINKRLRPAKYYEVPDSCLGSRRRLQYGNKLEIDIKTFVEIITADYALREIVQLEESIKRMIRSLEKTAIVEEKGTRLDQYDTRLRDIRRGYSYAERNLYFAESMFPLGPLQKSYDSLRQDPNWYLRKELARDCARRGGCCSRGCGCCEKRRSTTERSKGIGHCTVSCYCCSIARGFHYTEKEKQRIGNELRQRLEGPDPAYLTRMAEAYFLKPRGKMIQWRWWK
jgi:hypothetical protein